MSVWHTPSFETDWDRLRVVRDLLTNGRLVPDRALSGMLTRLGAADDMIPDLMRAAREAHFADFDRNLIGMALAYKEVGGQTTEAPCLRFYVSEKWPLRDLEPANAVPPGLVVPGIGAVLTDVVEIGTIRLNTFNGRLRPALGGYSIAHPSVRVGTIGCLVRKKSDPKLVYLLSCCHILADSGRAARGDDIWQPGPFDGGTAGDAMASLADFVRFRFTPLFDNAVDAAIAGPVTKAVCQSAIALIGHPQGVRPRVVPGTKVRKVGRTTRLQNGKVTAFHATLPIPYPVGVVKFIDLVETDCYSDSGDSGALVLDEEGYAVGLHMADSPRRPWPFNDPNRSFFCPISPVLAALGVDLVTQALP
jgi:hypothetical protein